MLEWINAAFIATAITLSWPSAPAFAYVGDSLQADGWGEVTFSRKVPNQFVRRDGGGIEVSSQDGVSLLKMPVMANIALEPTLSWRWRVMTPAPATDLSIKGDDDRSLAVYVAFPFVPAEATVFERIQRKIVEATLGKDVPGRLLVYVWGGLGERGDQVPSPHMGKAAMMKILRPGKSPTHQWFEEKVDLAEDYRRAFSSDPPDPIYIAISADTDDTNSKAKGVVIDLDFLARQKT